MKRIHLLFLLLFLGGSVLYAQQNLLIFYKTEGFKHESIPTGIKALKEIAEENTWVVTATDNAEVFVSELSKIDLVIFLSTTGNVFNESQEKEFRNYIEKGGSFFGIHAATDTEFDWPWYGKFIGAYFESHPHIQQAKINIEKPNHPTVAHLPEHWTRTDEWYNFKNINPEIQVLLTLDESSYEGGKNGYDHPIAWFQKFEGGGKMVYIAGGHTKESYHEAFFREHLERCIKYLLD
ncbi:ThuA domain-containing protein [Zunongwangia sp. HGR-M22]|uniref:ThuA domain-containing protein n=1 Tax=Zunongwangia sp. HGR-M22 TaxID=3015168 RepID=UPI0022DD7930|nr:ThuA domain-containing protein [Zunongwangia sp. HGR-M22]WBL25594.1 ThuA domain-containing protein [Zunongwangia sp. HGR-M22]